MSFFPDIYIGSIKHYSDNVDSAIEKKLVTGCLLLNDLGLDGDDHAEKKIHGGPDRALCHYPREHYTFWKQYYPSHQDIFEAPAFGENLSTVGLNEHNVYIGDIFRWGATLIQVTQPRSPCYKLNLHLEIDNFAQEMQNQGRCGWLYRILQPGKVCSGDALQLLSRNSNISVAEAISIFFNLPYDEEQYRHLLSCCGLSASWSQKLQWRLESEKKESFESRLFGPSGRRNPFPSEGQEQP